MASKIRWDREEFEPYLKHLADQFNLREWTISIDETGPGRPDAAAAVRHNAGRKIAVIDLSDNFLRDDEPSQRHVAVHEILHLHQAHSKHLLESILSGEQFRLWTLANEYGHDALTEAVAPLMPLPSEILDAPPEKSTAECASIA